MKSSARSKAFYDQTATTAVLRPGDRVLERKLLRKRRAWKASFILGRADIQS